MSTESQFQAIKLSGPDTVSFLQGQLTLDVSKLTEYALHAGAWLNPKGRVITVLDACLHGDGVQLVVPAELTGAITKRLSLYRLRADVNISAHAIYPSVVPEPPENVAARHFAASGSYECYDNKVISHPKDHAASRLAFGLPAITAANSEKFTAHQLNLDLLGAVRFDKGCYSGQEIVARTEHQGRTKRRTLRFVSQQPLSNQEDTAASNAFDSGQVVSAAQRSDGHIELLVLTNWPNEDRVIEDDSGTKFDFQTFTGFALP